jgi:predicted ATPase/DNA-binding SARP family transcriptional activator
MLKLFCLGTLRLEVDATPITLTPKANALFLYLAVTQRVHNRDLLADLLWSETNNQQARDNLRYLLPELRRPLGDYLVITPRDIAFQQQAPHWVDVVQLREALTSQPDAIATPTLQAALALYQGEFLAGFHVRKVPVFEAWVVQQREALHTLTVQGGYTLAERYWQQADYQPGLTATQRLFQWEPWHEAGHRLQMQLLAATGQRAAALAHYDRCRAILTEELGIEPEAATTALYEQIRNGPTDKVASLSWQDDKVATNQPVTQSPDHLVTQSSSPPHNLPGYLTPFFGREAEIEQIVALLVGTRYHLITLVGEGGSGKTRLAVAVGQRIFDFGFSILDSEQAVPINNPKSKIENPKFPDGVWFVPLSAVTITDNLADHLAVAVAQAIGLACSGEQPLFAQLLTYLHKKALVLLFDNVEHLLPDVAALLAQLLQASPLTKALVTSRHILNLQTEVVWRVTGVDLPPADDLPPSALLRSGSIALFTERASRRSPVFPVTAEDWAAIVAICRLVEGLPLAIELAAALTKQYSCCELAAALQQDYTILVTTFRDLPPRHRSIKAMLDHSWRLLTPTEAAILAASSVFPGSFDLSAATAVTGAGLTNLTTLVEQSLLQVVQQADGKRLYALHSLVRQYAAKQLQSQPAVAAHVQAQHGVYYLMLLVRQSDMLGCKPETLQKLQMELDNLRVAWAWAIAQGQFDLLRQSSTPLAQFDEMIGFYAEGKAAFGQVVSRLESMSVQSVPLTTEQIRLLARSQVEQAHFCARLTQVDQAEALVQAALPVGILHHDRWIETRSYLCLILIRSQQGDFAGVRTLAERAVASAKQAALPDLETAALHDLGMGFIAHGEIARGLMQLQSALTLAKRLGNLYLEAGISCNLGGGYYFAGSFAEARHHLQQVLHIHQAMNLPGIATDALLWLSELHIQLGCYDLAVNYAQKAQKVAQQIGRADAESDACAFLALTAYQQGKLAMANDYCQCSIQLAEAHNLALGQALASLVQGHLLSTQGQWLLATAVYTQAQQAYANLGQPLQAARAKAGLAQSWLGIGNLMQAVAQIEELLPMLEKCKHTSGVGLYETFLIGCEILIAAADPRTEALLHHGHCLLQEQAARLDDEALRRSFLEQVAANRKLVALWSAQQQHSPHGGI